MTVVVFSGQGSVDPMVEARSRFENALREMNAAFNIILQAIDRGPVEKELTVRVSEAARRLGVSKQKIYRMARAGELTFLQIGGVACVRVKDLKELTQ